MKKLSLVLTSVSILGGLVFFQNCSSGGLPSNVSSTTTTSSSTAASTANPCLLDGTASVASGLTEAGIYSVSAAASGAACPSSATLTCTNGVWSGTVASSSTGVSTGGDSTTVVSYSAAYSTCTAAAGCTFNGATIASGSSTVAYSAASVAYGSDCSTVEQTLTCANGTLTTSSGAAATSYTYAACTTSAFSGKWTFSYYTSGVNYYVTPNACQGTAGNACTTSGQSCFDWSNQYYDGSQTIVAMDICK